MTSNPDLIPRCSHGNIILGCPNDDCPEQVAYLDGQEAQISLWFASQQAEARRIVRSLLGLDTQ